VVPPCRPCLATHQFAVSWAYRGANAAELADELSLPRRRVVFPHRRSQRARVESVRSFLQPVCHRRRAPPSLRGRLAGMFERGRRRPFPLEPFPKRRVERGACAMFESPNRFSPIVLASTPVPSAAGPVTPHIVCRAGCGLRARIQRSSGATAYANCCTGGSRLAFASACRKSLCRSSGTQIAEHRRSIESWHVLHRRRARGGFPIFGRRVCRGYWCSSSAVGFAGGVLSGVLGGEEPGCRHNDPLGTCYSRLTKLFQLQRFHPKKVAARNAAQSFVPGQRLPVLFLGKPSPSIRTVESPSGRTFAKSGMARVPQAGRGTRRARSRILSSVLALGVFTGRRKSLERRGLIAVCFRASR